MDLIKGLNDSQAKAVLHKEGPVVIVSVAGSGKTRVLTHRTAHLIKESGVNPSKILLTTFSSKARDEMKERLQSLLTKDEINQITIGTFHSIGRSILKSEYTRMNDPMKEAFSFEKPILTGAPQKWKIEEIMVKQLEMDLKGKNTITVPEVVGAISTAKNKLLDYKQLYFRAITKEEFEIAEIYKLYEEYKYEELIIDFDDMILNLYKMFTKYPDILKKYQDKFEYIMVDESQDNNSAQYKLVDMLAGKKRNKFLVGDDDQSMYRFRGARPDEFINFGNQEDVIVINLEHNYRSTPGILNVANKLIDKNKIRLPKKLVPYLKPSSEKDVEYVSFETDDEEGKYVADMILSNIEKGRFYSDCAVIYRTNSQSRALEDYLIQNSIPYVIHGGVSFYERKEVKDLVAYMNLAVDPNNNEAFERVVNTPTRYLGKAFINTLKAEAKKKRTSLYKAMKTAKLTPQQHKNGMAYMNLISKIQLALKNNSSTVGLINEIITLTNYDVYLKQQSPEREEDNDIMENIEILKSAVSKHQSIHSFLDFLDVLTKSKKTNKDAVQLMTIHRSKGLEFPVVFAIGFSDNLLPHRYALESGDPNSIEEERRLAYVAITRAQQMLYVTSPLNIASKSLAISRFVYDAQLLAEHNKEENKEESKEGR